MNKTWFQDENGNVFQKSDKPGKTYGGQLKRPVADGDRLMTDAEVSAWRSAKREKDEVNDDYRLAVATGHKTKQNLSGL